MSSALEVMNWAIGPRSCPITGCPSRGRYCWSLNGISCIMVGGTHHELNKIFRIFSERNGVREIMVKYF